jgi:uncharacterized membrane protein (UPF0127 family)
VVQLVGKRKRIAIKNAIVAIVVIVAVYLLYEQFLCNGICRLDNSFQKTNITINDSASSIRFSAYLATTPYEWDLGYMNVTSLGENCNMSTQTGFDNCRQKGMLFEFYNQSVKCFWMKNTIIPLEQVWIGSNGVILYVYNATPLSTVPICHLGTYVLETNTIYIPIQVGDTLSFSKT